MKHRPGPKVPYSIGGKTHMVSPPTPRPPLSLDRILLAVITAACTLLLVAVAVWATVNIGELLTGMVPGWAAYGAASAFNLAWVICLGLEWIARHSPDKAAAPRGAGWWFLAAEMIAVGVHGHHEGSLVIGIVGAAVSAIVKGVWTLLLTYHATPLDPMTQQWVDAERAQLAAERGLLHVQGDALYARAHLARQAAALGVDQLPARRPAQLDAAPATEPATPGVAPAATPVPAGHAYAAAQPATVEDPVQLTRVIDAALDRDGMSRADMVRAVIKVAPHLTAREIADAIGSRRGVEVKPSYVRTIRTGRPKTPAAPERPGPDHTAGPYL